MPTNEQIDDCVERIKSKAVDKGVRPKAKLISELTRLCLAANQLIEELANQNVAVEIQVANRSIAGRLYHPFIFDIRENVAVGHQELPEFATRG